MNNAVQLRDVQFSYEQDISVFEQLSLDVPMYSFVLLLGENGTGKSTLLKIIGGKHLIRSGRLTVLGKDPFGSFLDSKSVGLVQCHFPLTLDISVAEILKGRPKYSDVLASELMRILGVSTEWRMHRVSRGQRTRVELLLALLDEPKLLLLDEVLSDLDILVRYDFLTWIHQRALKKQLTVICATHILDGMERWASHLLCLGGAKSDRMTSLYQQLDMNMFDAECKRRRIKTSLLELCEQWFKESRL